MKKKILSLLMVGAMSASMLIGCGGGGSTAESEVSSEIDMDEEAYECSIQVVILPGMDYSAQESAMEEALNELTKPAINCTVDIQFVSIAEVANTTQMQIAADEKIDLVHVATVSPISAMVGQDLLLDLTDLLEKRGQDIKALYDESILVAGMADDQLLAIPAKQYNVSGKGIYYNKTVADANGITVPESGTIDDLEAVLKQVAEKTDIMPFFVGEGKTNYLYWMTSYNSFGDQAAYGAIIDEIGGASTIENLYASDMFEDFCLRMYQWRQAGILQKNQEDTNQAQTYFNEGQLFAVVTDITPALEAQYKAQAQASGFEAEFMTLVEPAVTNSVVQEYMWGIAANSERPDKAMDLLNYLYSADGAAAANILLYGLEGENYEKVEGSENVIATNGSYLASFMVIGDQSKIAVQAPNDDTFVQQNEEMMASAKVSNLIGYMYTANDFSAEAGAVSNVIVEYLPRLQNGVCESEDATKALIDEFNAALESAGINEIIADNQAHLDEFIANK